MVETLQEKDTVDPDALAQGLGRAQNLAGTFPASGGERSWTSLGKEAHLCSGLLLSLPEAGGKTHQSTSWAPMRSCTW